MPSTLELAQEIRLDQSLTNLYQKTLMQPLLSKKISLLKNFEETKKFLEQALFLQKILTQYPPRKQLILYSLLAIGQGPVIFPRLMEKKEIDALLKSLLPVEKFYQRIGGVLGYHITCMELLLQKEKKNKKGIYHSPNPLDISTPHPQIDFFSLKGVFYLDQLAQVYPLGGAADRLFIAEESKFQIAASLQFCEKTLLERLIEDVQALEFLHYKIFDRQVSVPVVLMTSEEKRGNRQIRQTLKKRRFFGKNKQDFFVVAQPLVPTMNKEGRWCVIGPGHLLLKPGGHGVIWKLMKDYKILQWLKEKNRQKILVRQINNIIAGVDYGLLAFLGIGFLQNKEFGFAACPRAKGACEGVNLVIENEEGYCLTNIEYCDMQHFQVGEESPLLANTNLLFVDVDVIAKLLQKVEIPGMLVNAKKIKYKKSNGLLQEEEVLRLESTMQNLADALVETNIQEKTFITCNQRLKTISSLKKEFVFGSSLQQTPEQCYLDSLENAKDLLVNHCNFIIPDKCGAASFFESGPPFSFLYHPALGPLYQVIAQKLKGGRLALGSELKLQIAELSIENLSLEGSLQILTEAVMGNCVDGVLQYSKQTGKCTLKNVQVDNLGIDRQLSRSFWKNEIIHQESCRILIEEGGEFFAENVQISGNVTIVVPAYTKVTAFMVGERLQWTQEKLEAPSWSWTYTVVNDSVMLSKK